MLEAGVAAALVVSVFAGDLVSAGADLLPETLDLESLDFDSLLEESFEELSDELLPELLFDA